MTASSDIAYGRQGGRLEPARRNTAAGICNLCGWPMVLGQVGSHLVCAEQAGLEHPQRITPNPEPKPRRKSRS